MTTTPLVDIIMPTYNHERFIAQSIESVLAQQTNFEYRLNIADDCSTDNTQMIIKDYAQKHPDQISVVLSPHNIGIVHKDRLSIRVLKLCTAKYVALLEGDDYWTDPHKLQRQVDFLEGHPDFAICCHNVTMFYEDGSGKTTNLLPPDHPEVSTLEHLLFVNFIPTCSVLFRRGLFGELPDWYYTLKLGDWPIHIMNAQHGKIGYINEVMAAYRFHQGGFWSAMSPVSQGLEIIKMLQHVDAYLGFNYKKQIRAGKAEWYWQLAEISHRDGDRANTRRFLRQYCLLSKFRDPWKVTSLFLRGYLPGLYRGLRTMRNWAQSNGATSSSMLNGSKDSKG
jgi:glycosyltransferase involved in cell wall biosynthesis